MTANPSPLKLIIKRFADLQKEQIEHIYQTDQTFREICHDYAECIRMRDKYAADAANPNAPHFRQDYEALIESLEDEMLTILRECMGERRKQE